MKIKVKVAVLSILLYFLVRKSFRPLTIAYGNAERLL